MNVKSMTDEQLISELKIWNGVNRIIELEIKKEQWRRESLSGIVVDKPIIIESKDKPKVIYYTSKELYSLNKSEQVNLLKSFGVTDIPKNEDGRVNLLLELKAKK